LEEGEKLPSFKEERMPEGNGVQEYSPENDSCIISDLDDLKQLYKAVNPISLAKETQFLTPEYQRWIEAAPFFALASVGEGGLDCSPRGDKPEQLFRILDERTIAIPDRRGNNRIDTLTNIVGDPRVAMLFLLPGVDETLRINGRAYITTHSGLLDYFEVAGKKPASVVVVKIDVVYFQCARALTRAKLWDVDSFCDPAHVPTAGQMTRAAKGDFDSEAYDAELRGRQKATMY
jgi:PPOX class probable FMN-dependent enzyme